MRQRIPLMVVLLAVVFFTTPLSARFWTNKQGQKVAANFLRMKDGDVYLSVNGRAVIVPFENLSPADQEFLRKKLKAEHQEALLPPDEKVDPPADARLPSPTAERTWTDVKERQIQAQLVGMEDGKVVLLLHEKEKAVPFKSLCVEDQKYVRGAIQAELSMKPVDAQPGTVGAIAPPAQAGGPQEIASSESPPVAAPPAMPPASAFAPPPMPTPKPFSLPPLPVMKPPEMPPIPTPQVQANQPSSFFNSPALPSPQMQMVPIYGCTKCKKPLPSNIHAGDDCPYCGAYLAYETDQNGKVTSRAPFWTWWKSGMGMGAIIGGIIGLINYLRKQN